MHFRKKRLIFFIILFIILVSIFVLAETTGFRWFLDGVSCGTTSPAGPTCDSGTTCSTAHSDDSPSSRNISACCASEKDVRVRFCTYVTVDDELPLPRWEYSPSVGRLYAYTVSYDESQDDCGCYSSIWMPGKTFESESAQPDCCGDDAGEVYEVCEAETGSDIVWCSGQEACCASAKCVDKKGNCKESGSSHSDLNIGGNDSKSFCNSNLKWADCDYDSTTCNDISICGLHWIQAREFSAFGEYTTGTALGCCGDDANEYYTTQGFGTACCDDIDGCVDRNGRCQGEASKEVSCEPWDGFDDDCDGKTDCSDSDCYLDPNSVCAGCEPEICNNFDQNGNPKDDDCDHYANCADNDCLDHSYCIDKGCYVEQCYGGNDEDCDGKVDCEDTDCIGVPGGCEDCKPEDCEDEDTPYNPDSDDCDSLINNADWDCPGCPKGTALCEDSTCSDDCETTDAGKKGCLNPNGICEEFEGCTCEDCNSTRDSCYIGLTCDPFYDLCLCPSGTRFCPDNTCKEDCSVCGNGLLEPGEECDPYDINNPDDDVFGAGSSSCPTGCDPGTLTCTDTCLVSESCICPTVCDPQNKDDAYCCIEGTDCDIDCKAISSDNCASCDFIADDCCNDAPDNECDPDCISGVDPDCLENCYTESDDCCTGLDDGICDPDCEADSDSDCVGKCTLATDTSTTEDCCYPIPGDGCDKDCIPGVDPDCKCGNLLIDTGEMCDRTNLSITQCENFFDPNYRGVLECFAPGTENECHYDTSGCYKPECEGGDPDGVCGIGEEDCRCADCLGEQATCGYGQVCDETASCKCEDGKTLCNDGTCRLPAECEANGGGFPTCNNNAQCEPGEGCNCPDCRGKEDTCKQTSVCLDGICTSCSILKAYWSEDCIGSGVELYMIAEGTPGCEGNTVTFEIWEEGAGSSLAEIKSEFSGDQKSEGKWKPDITGNDETYYFKAIIGSEIYESTELEVEYCIPDCDADCDRYCDTGKATETGPVLGTACATAWVDGYCETEDFLGTGDIKIDANAMSGWCEDCSPDGLSPGQETCAAYYDCTPGWWTKEGKVYSDYWITDPDDLLEWSECDEATMTRTREICPDSNNCCTDINGDGVIDENDQSNCYCKLPTDAPEGLNCDDVAFLPSTEKACLAEEKFPFFTNMNILIVVLILIGFYLWRTKVARKKTKKRARKSKAKVL